jgi:pimeloyl-ACP methyl ester carboxylesterase
MPTFKTFDELDLSYHDEGDGRTIVLLHGFAADTNINYVRSGILDVLLDEGYRVIALDLRGHGLSARPIDVEAYLDDAMKQDVAALFDHLGLDDVVLVGYSMGADLALRFAADDSRVKALALLGIGAERGDDSDTNWRGDLIAALESDALDLDDAAAGRVRITAGLDRAPLVALLKASAAANRQRPARPTVPVLLAVGVDDENATDPGPLAEQLGATFVQVPGDHFTANSAPDLHRSLTKFLAEQ